MHAQLSRHFDDCQAVPKECKTSHFDDPIGVANRQRAGRSAWGGAVRLARRTICQPVDAAHVRRPSWSARTVHWMGLRPKLRSTLDPSGLIKPGVVGMGYSPSGLSALKTAALRFWVGWADLKIRGWGWISSLFRAIIRLRCGIRPSTRPRLTPCTLLCNCRSLKIQPTDG